MAKSPKVYTVTETKRSTYGNSEPRVYSHTGTLEELVKAYGYTLECGSSYEHEKGNKKINRNPKSIDTLVKNLYNAKNNSAANGYSGSSYSFVEVSNENV